MTAKSHTDAVTIRTAKPEDAEACGRICYAAFYKINQDHGFPPDLSGPEHTLAWAPGQEPGRGERLVEVEQDLNKSKFYAEFVEWLTRTTPAP